LDEKLAADAGVQAQLEALSMEKEELEARLVAQSAKLASQKEEASRMQAEMDR
jgi:hypothetical protein